MRKISSRIEEIAPFKDLTDNELKLITSMLYVVQLGDNGSVYRHAAFSLITKIEDARGSLFMSEAFNDVNFDIRVLDDAGCTVLLAPAGSTQIEV